MCHVTFLMSHVTLCTLWQGRGMSFCWNELQPDTDTVHKIKNLVRSITWSIGLKYQTATMKSTECSHCKQANSPHPVCFSFCCVFKDRKGAPSFPFLTLFQQILLFWNNISLASFQMPNNTLYWQEPSLESERIGFKIQTGCLLVLTSARLAKFSQLSVAFLIC